MMKSRSKLCLSIICLAFYVEGSALERQHQATFRKAAFRHHFIANGTIADHKNWPFIVSVSFNVTPTFSGCKYEHQCGGSIINQRQVLTAAHCFHSALQGQRDYFVLPGIYYNYSSIDCDNNDRFYHRVSKIDIHPLYDADTDDNDIAILTLATPLLYGPLIKRVPYAYPGYKIEYPCWIGGFGFLSNNEEFVSDVLMQAKFKRLYPLKDCIQNYTNLHRESQMKGEVVKIIKMPNKNNICAGGLGGDACRGDSGGPLVCGKRVEDRVLIGIVSWGLKECASNAPGIYLKVSRYLKWIVQRDLRRQNKVLK